MLLRYAQDRPGVRGNLRLRRSPRQRRYTSGTTPTTYRFTGQREQNELGLYFYQSRYYDPYLNRWVQPDSIIPNPINPLDWDRYQYVRSNPTKYNDPNGHNLNCGMQGSSASSEDCQEADPDGDGEIPLFSSWPDSEDVPNPEDRSDYINKALEYYEKMRIHLYDTYRWKYLSREGKIDDITLMAMIIFGSCNNFSVKVIR